MNSNNQKENVNNSNMNLEIFTHINNTYKKNNRINNKSSEYIYTNSDEEKIKFKTNSKNIERNRNKSTLSDDMILKKSENLNIKINKKNVYNILVAVRCRPLNKKEKEISTKETIKIIDDKIVKLKDPNSFLNPNNIRAKEKIMNFDYAFSPSINQEQIFNSTTKFLIENVINGFNATVFAYGVTGAGKTYTMLGNDENPGIMVWTLRELYKKIKEYKNREYLIKLWYVEIYNENIRDLLNNKSENLELREDPDEGIIINNVTEIMTNSINEILKLLKKGNKNRTTEETDVNKTSSRSHAILQIKVSFKEKNNDGNNEVRYGKLNLIDLAGSERAGTTKNRGLRLIEGANINKSLLTLGNCINALYEKNLKHNSIYIPYRDSKLTRLLKDSLGGNSRTVMIANVSPFIYNFDDTYNTLKYAERAKCIKTKVKMNIADINNKSNDFLKLIKNMKIKLNEIGNKDSIVNKNINIDINNDNNNNNRNNKRLNSLNIKNSSANKIKRNTYDFQETFSNKDMINIKTKNKIKDMENIRRNTNKKLKESKTDNDINKGKDIEDIMHEKDKKISLIIEDYIQQSEAEIQLKQKIINIQYNLILLYNKIQKNLSFKKNNSEDKIKLKNLKQMFEKNIETLEEMTERNENFIKKYIENNSNNNCEENIEFNNLQKKFLYMIFKNTKIEKENIEIKFKYTIMKNYTEKNDNYIKELEKQIKLRDLIIKELLFFDNMTKHNSVQDNNLTKPDYKTIISTILSKEKNIQYQPLSKLKEQYKPNVKNKRNIQQHLKRENFLYFNDNSDNNLYHNTNGTNEEYLNKKQDYIIDFDKDKANGNDSYINLKIPSLIKSNSSFNINYFERINSKNLINQNNNKKENNSETHINKTSYGKYIKESEETLRDNNKEENTNILKSILMKIKNANSEISSKMSIIENQSNRNINKIGIAGKIKNIIINKKNESKDKTKNLNELSQDNLKLDIKGKQPNLNKLQKRITENLNKANDDINYTINLQINSNKIIKGNCKEKITAKNYIIKSENNKNKISKIDINKIEPISSLSKIVLSKEKTENKNKESEKKFSQNKSFITNLNKNNINHINKKMEKNKSTLNKINNNKSPNLKLIIKEKDKKCFINDSNYQSKKGYYNQNQKNKINIKLIKENINEKKSVIYTANSFYDKIHIQNKPKPINKNNKENKSKIERFIKIEQ